jgi:DNA-binding response OmpR family regulator
MPKTILCLDDEASLLELYKQELTENNCRVVTATTASEALRRVEAEKVDLIVLDIRLAEESGLDVLEDIRKKQPDLPVIICSAYGSYKQDFHSWLANEYIVKSANLSELKWKVRALLKI